MAANFLDKTFGRLGNRMFQMAALYKYAKMNGTDFYFQNPKWFEGCEDEIKSLFGADIFYDDRVAIHVRRGDYVNNPFYADLTKTDYYEKAFDLFPNDRFLMFSDDIQFCIDKWGGKPNVMFSKGHTEEEDLKKIASCKSVIMANSSFSWWGAYLGDHEKVIYPKNWYSDGVQRTVCPKEWICL